MQDPGPRAGVPAHRIRGRAQHSSQIELFEQPIMSRVKFISEAGRRGDLGFCPFLGRPAILKASLRDWRNPAELCAVSTNS